MNRSTKCTPFYLLYSLVLFRGERNEFFVQRIRATFRSARNVATRVGWRQLWAGQVVADTYRVSKYCCHQQTRAVRIRERAILIRYRRGATLPEYCRATVYLITDAF